LRFFKSLSTGLYFGLEIKSILSVIDTMKKVINLDNVEEIVKIYNNQLFKI
jgi:hypothetical protein